MAFDYWHLRRFLRIAGSDRDLPFTEPPYVIGPVLTMPEPVWRSLVATALDKGVDDVFAAWSWEMPLQHEAAAVLAMSLNEVINQVARSRTITVSSDIAPDALPDTRAVLGALRALLELLNLAVQKHLAVETWVE